MKVGWGCILASTTTSPASGDSFPIKSNFRCCMNFGAQTHFQHRNKINCKLAKKKWDVWWFRREKNKYIQYFLWNTLILLISLRICVSNPMLDIWETAWDGKLIKLGFYHMNGSPPIQLLNVVYRFLHRTTCSMNWSIYLAITMEWWVCLLNRTLNALDHTVSYWQNITTNVI